MLLPAPGFELVSFWLISSCQGNSGIFVALLPIPIGGLDSGGLSRGPQNRYCCHQQHNPVPLHPIEQVCSSFANSPELPGQPIWGNFFWSWAQTERNSDVPSHYSKSDSIVGVGKNTQFKVQWSLSELKSFIWRCCRKCTRRLSFDVWREIYRDEILPINRRTCLSNLAGWIV